MSAEKDQLIALWEREHKTTMKVLKAFPPDRAELKPHDLSKSARELAWVFASEAKFFSECASTGKIDFTLMRPAPATMHEVIGTYEKEHAAVTTTIKNLSDEQFNAMVDFFTGPKTMGKVRAGDILWMAAMDLVHHRGQFSVYLRMAGGKVPSIYGPSHDEPWM
jgi:uncharacterized damage-inducible protein DinB